MKEPIWMQKQFVLALHEKLLALFGGLAGIRDAGLLESALGRPAHQFAYEKPNLFDLAAAYAFGIVRNHPFLDGNKRTGLIAATSFLERNGSLFNAAEPEATVATLALADGTLAEEAYSRWLADHCVKRGKKIPKRR
jgi:death-on-curing protein